LGVVAQARQVAANQVRGLALDIAALIPVALGPAHPALHFLAGVVSVILIVQVKVTVRRAALIVEMAELGAGIRVLRVALMIKVVSADALLAEAGHVVARVLVLRPVPEPEVDTPRGLVIPVPDGFLIDSRPAHGVPGLREAGVQPQALHLLVGEPARARGLAVVSAAGGEAPGRVHDHGVVLPAAMIISHGVVVGQVTGQRAQLLAGLAHRPGLGGLVLADRPARRGPGAAVLDPRGALLQQVALAAVAGILVADQQASRAIGAPVVVALIAGDEPVAVGGAEVCHEADPASRVPLAVLPRRAGLVLAGQRLAGGALPQAPYPLAAVAAAA